jgi:hypothetical protein
MSDSESLESSEEDDTDEEKQSGKDPFPANIEHYD